MPGRRVWNVHPVPHDSLTDLVVNVNVPESPVNVTRRTEVASTARKIELVSSYLYIGNNFFVNIVKPNLFVGKKKLRYKCGMFNVIKFL